MPPLGKKNLSRNCDTIYCIRNPVWDQGYMPFLSHWRKWSLINKKSLLREGRRIKKADEQKIYLFGSGKFKIKETERFHEGS